MSTKTAMPTGVDRLGAIASSYIASSALNAVVRLNIADLLGDDEQPASVLAQKTQSNEDALYRVLRLLSSLEIFTEVRDRVFANNEASNPLRADVPNSQRPMIEFITDPFHLQVYADMLPTIKTGETAVKHAFKKDCFDVLKDDPEEQRRFDDAMTNMSRRTAPLLLQEYDFSGIETLVDIGGGHGMILTSILQKYPGMKGIVFDLPHVTSGAQKRISEMGLGDRCSTASGDFFKSVPSGDAYIMKHIIHDWDDERSIAILKNCHSAMAKSGARKLLLVEMILSGRNESDPSKFLDIEMLMLPGGRERTEQEFKELLQKAGFKLTRVVRTQAPTTIIEAVPA